MLRRFLFSGRGDHAVEPRVLGSFLLASPRMQEDQYHMCIEDKDLG